MSEQEAASASRRRTLRAGRGGDRLPRDRCVLAPASAHPPAGPSVAARL